MHAQDEKGVDGPCTACKRGRGSARAYSTTGAATPPPRARSEQQARSRRGQDRDEGQGASGCIRYQQLPRIVSIREEPGIGTFPSSRAIVCEHTPQHREELSRTCLDAHVSVFSDYLVSREIESLIV